MFFWRPLKIEVRQVRSPHRRMGPRATCHDIPRARRADGRRLTTTLRTMANAEAMGTAPRMCVCVFSSHPFWASSSLDVPAGVTQEEGHTGFFIHLLSAVRALIFLARRIQPFLALVDREVECTKDLIVLHPLGIFIFIFYFLVRKIPFVGIELTSQRARRLRGYV